MNANVLRCVGRRRAEEATTWETHPRDLHGEAVAGEGQCEHAADDDHPPGARAQFRAGGRGRPAGRPARWAVVGGAITRSVMMGLARITFIA